MSANLPIRRDKFDTQNFLAYLSQQGCEIGVPTNRYEVVRYRAYWRGTNKAATHIVYAKENGLLTWTGGSKGHYRAFLAGAPVDELLSVPQAPTPASKAVSKSEKTRAKLLARDGDECWFCGDAMGADCTIEHLVPKSTGGRNSLANYALAHRKCNNDAADLPLIKKIEMRASMRSVKA
ncbi:HNH endonuclease [Allopontixanthobacter sediminis]|uniref:HNH nuclease domain-containing protein n=1 Tax=Allopontixanthobacter sediminis TaxID=1689985 RepID=A0A845AYJ9_9SPHN|nr:HNH endonuclease signature motif containing protein [Allopontixanthobacter sediminis]MXP42954.1 hypothetical protein [Allopontixanthobacter sediminis]